MATHKVRGREECGGRGSAGVKMKAVNDVLQQDSAWERHSAITPFDPDRKDNLKPQRSLPSTHRTCHSAVPPPRGGSLHSGHSLVPRGIKIADHADGATHCLLHNHCTLTCTSEKIASNRPVRIMGYRTSNNITACDLTLMVISNDPGDKEVGHLLLEGRPVGAVLDSTHVIVAHCSVYEQDTCSISSSVMVQPRNSCVTRLTELHTRNGTHAVRSDWHTGAHRSRWGRSRSG
jgi:hypothetical protein